MRQRLDFTVFLGGGGWESFSFFLTDGEKMGTIQSHLQTSGMRYSYGPAVRLYRATAF